MTEVPLEWPSVQRIVRVARALGNLSNEVVFIGGAIAPLLQQNPPFDSPRPTKDADAVTASAKYADLEKLNVALRDLKFRHDLSETNHIHRWRSPDGDILDLVPAGQHPGGSGQLWDQLALETSQTVTLADGTTFRHASAPAFLALKWAAYDDRGASDPFGSHDLEDILALLAARPSLVAEVEKAPREIRKFVGEKSSLLLGLGDFDDLVAAHLNNAQDAFRVIQRVRETLVLLAGQDPAKNAPTL
jgi:predicted nucleotidyltransferase